MSMSTPVGDLVNQVRGKVERQMMKIRSTLGLPLNASLGNYREKILSKVGLRGQELLASMKPTQILKRYGFNPQALTGGPIVSKVKSMRLGGKLFGHHQLGYTKEGGEVLDFKDRESYLAWLRGGHAKGVFDKNRTTETVRIGGRPHKLKHDYEGESCPPRRKSKGKRSKKRKS